jgi:hypothetical protein
VQSIEETEETHMKKYNKSMAEAMEKHGKSIKKA